MRIIYFTTACSNDDYTAFFKSWQLSLNISIQNLHNRLIRSLALTHEIDVISARPFSKKYCKLKMLPAFTKQEGKITWHYLEIKRNKLVRSRSAQKQAYRLLSKMNLKDCIILTDTLNPYLLKSATSLAEKYHLPIIGVCNNTPSGIHNTGKSYTVSLLGRANNLSGYITLTSGLNELYNEHSVANLTFEGILDNKFQEIDVSKYGNYIFYHGSLDAQAGVFELIEAFKKLNRGDIKLIISGYHGNNHTIENIIKDKNIVHLGMISNDEALSLENHALININPRPYSEDYDRYLIPDNVIDFLGSKAVTVSVKNKRLQTYFESDAIWVDSSDVDDLLNGINEALALKDRDSFIKKANSDANKLYAMGVINRNPNHIA